MLLLERADQDPLLTRDAMDEWLTSELQYVDAERQELNMALGLSGG